MATIQEALDLAWQHQQAGKLAEAEHVYRQILAAVPNQADAWHRLGILAMQAHNPAAAVDAINRAIDINPHDAAYYLNLGNAYQALGRSEEALKNFRLAVKVNRVWPDGHYALGLALVRANLLHEAAVELAETTRLAPLNAQAFNELGIVLARAGRMDEAAEAFRQTTRLRPDYADAYNNLGNVRLSQGRVDEAIGRYRKAIELKPENYHAHAHLGIAYSRMGKTNESIQWLERAVQLKPDSADAQNNLGNAFLVGGQVQRALDDFQAALRLDANYAPAISNYLLALNYDPEITPQRIADEHRTWAARLENVPRAATGFDNTPDADRVLRVGYVSPDFRTHPVAAFMFAALAKGNRERVVSILLADVTVADAMTRQIESLAHAWHNTTGLSHDQIAELARRERIDILVDLSGHTAGNRLGVFVLRPAPVQATYIGYPATTGLTSIDYLVTDDLVDPPGEEPLYSESLVRLPGGFSCYTPREDAPAVGPLPAIGSGRVTFGTLHNLAKLNDRVLGLWARVVRAVPGSRLLIARDVLTGHIAETITRELELQGLAPDDFELRNEFPAGGHQALYHEIDIALDSMPWSGHTSACEAMWMGVPTVSLVGGRHASRMVASVLTQAGMSDWLAKDADEFVAIAVRAASDLDRLASLRSGLRQQMAASALCDSDRFAGELEDAYRGMWAAWCRQRG